MFRLFLNVSDPSLLAKWSSLEIVSGEDNDHVSPSVVVEQNGRFRKIHESFKSNCNFSDDSIFSQSYLQRVASERRSRRVIQINKVNSLDASFSDSPAASPAHFSCNTTVLLLVMHAGSVLGKISMIQFKLLYRSNDSNSNSGILFFRC